MSYVRGVRRIQPRRSARCEMRGVRSNSVCGVAELGADGPARRSSSVGRTRRTGPPPSSFTAGCRGPRQDGQAAKTKLLTRSRLRFWTRAWGQRELADERTGRLKSPARLQDLFKGGLDIPPTHVQFSSLRREHPIWAFGLGQGRRTGDSGTGIASSAYTSRSGGTLRATRADSKSAPGQLRRRQ